MRYYQYIEPVGENDYIYTVPIRLMEDGTEKELNPRRGCRVIQATLSGKSNPAQENGSAITYARRYSLLMAFGLATDDDDAQCMTRTKNENKPKEQKQAKSEEQLNAEMAASVDQNLLPSGRGMDAKMVKDILSELERTGVSIDTILSAYQIKDLKAMTEAQYISCLNRLKKSKDKA